MSSKKYKLPKPTKKQRTMDIVYLIILLVVFEVIGIILVVFPRSTESELEKRKLAEFPEFTFESYFSGDFTADISNWFSDTVPMRDDLTQMSMSIRELRGIRQDGIRLHGVSAPVQQESLPEPIKPVPPTTSAPVQTIVSTTQSEAPQPPESDTPQTTTTHTNQEIVSEDIPIPEDDAVSINNNGTAVVGDRGLMLYGGSFAVGERYAAVINRYKEIFGDNVNVYSMIIPTACEFYSPPEVQIYCGSERDNINNVIYNLRDDVVAVNVYSTLSSHLDEDIFLRTDHHWAPLGAYYAAKEFAKEADVPFMELSEYEERVVKNYVGTMYTYTEDIMIKNNPEDFIYYVPNGVEYTTTYNEYIIEDGLITGMAQPVTGNFFYKYPDGSSMAYCTFMGGDSKIVKVETNAGTGRKLVILKDSFGNALPPFLFASFDEIHVVDMRYFTHNMVEYVNENGITDILFANNAFHAATGSTVTYYNNFLTQTDWGY